MFKRIHIEGGETIFNVQPEKLLPLTQNYVGGPDVVEMLVDRYERCRTQAEIGCRFGIDQGHVSRKLRAARNRLQSIGMWPEHWREPTRDRVMARLEPPTDVPDSSP